MTSTKARANASGYRYLWWHINQKLILQLYQFITQLVAINNYMRYSTTLMNGRCRYWK